MGGVWTVELRLMVLKRGLVLCCAALMLGLAWAPVAFIAVEGLGKARERVRSILELGYGASVLPSSRVGTAVFLDPRVVPAPQPAPVELPGSLQGSGNERYESPAPPRSVWPRELPSALSERPYARLVEQAADRHGVDPRLVHALIEVESGYRADAVSGSGAMGLMQLMPLTAKRYGVADPLDPEANIEAGTRHLRSLLDEFGPLYALDALAAYHAGEPIVRRHGGIPPYPQTHRFVSRVLHALLSQSGWGGGD